MILMQRTGTRRTIWCLIVHAKIGHRRQLHLALVATARPIAALGEIHIVIGVAVAVPEAETHITSVTAGENPAGVLDVGTLTGEIEIVGIKGAIGMTVGIGTGIGIEAVEMIGMSDDDEGGICVNIDNIKAYVFKYSKHLMYNRLTEDGFNIVSLPWIATQLLGSPVAGHTAPSATSTGQVSVSGNWLHNLAIIRIVGTIIFIFLGGFRACLFRINCLAFALKIIRLYLVVYLLADASAFHGVVTVCKIT